MNEILQRWLSTRLGVVFDMDPMFFGMNVSDGILLGRLLHSYDVISEEQLRLIVTANNAGSRFLNLKCLHKWLEYIGVECDDNMLREVADCVGSTAIRLFYQVFLCLENTDKAHFINEKKKADCVSEMLSRFHVTRVTSSKECKSVRPIQTKKEILIHPFCERQNLIEKQKIKFEAIREMCKANRLKFEELVREKSYPEYTECEDGGSRSSTKDIMDQEIAELDERLGTENDEVELTYSELKLSGDKVKEYDVSCGCINLANTKDYIKQLNMKTRKDAATRMFEVQMQNLLAKELWRKLVDAQEQELDNLITKKLLKQSQYEKQMTTKLFQVRHEKKLVAENRALVEKMFIARRDQEFSDSLDRDRNEIDAQRQMNDLEADRNRELHDKLYAEKMQLRYEKHYDMCMDVMDAFVDLAVKAADFREQNENVIPKKIWDEWKEIFIKNQPIFELIDDIEKIVDDEFAKDMEEIVIAEFGRQEVLNEHDMREYMQLIGPWLLEELNPELQNTAETQNVLGYIVHRLLDLKYPLPPPPQPADLPPMNAAAIVLGVQDPEVIETLHQLLAKREINVILLEDAINYCLEEFRKEMSVVRDIDMRLCNATKHALDEIKTSPVSKMDKKDKKQAKENKASKKEKKKSEKKMEKKKEKAGKGKKGAAHKAEEIIIEEQGVPHEEKETQTPRLIPDDDPLLTFTASLGQQAFDVLCMGEQIPDPLLVKMLVELLKSKKDMQGWVIFNYPVSYEQASLLEELLTGRRLPPTEPLEQNIVEVIEEIEERLINEEEEEVTPLAELRVSKLVPNTLPPAPTEEFRTYFTAYINAKKADVEGEQVEEVIVEETLSPLEEIYTDQGMNYDFYYRTFDFATIKQLAKLIVGDLQLPLKSSLELFGDVMEQVEKSFELALQKAKKTTGGENPDGKVRKKTKEKKGKGKAASLKEIPAEEPVADVPDDEVDSKKNKKKGKGGKEDKKKGKEGKEDKKGKGGKDKKGKGKGANVTEEVQPAIEEPPPVEDLALELEPKMSTSEERRLRQIEPPPPPLPPKPGDYGWPYTNLELAPTVQEAIATMWENMEEVYLEDFKEIFFLKRVFHAKIIPYLNHVKREINEFIRRPDTKQDHVFTFQIRYNEIDEELRPDLEMKNELYCRLAELRSLLWTMCDTRKQEAEVQRRMLIADDWVSEEMCCLTNIMAIAMELEVNRCVDTLQLLGDYYLTMLYKDLPETRLGKMYAARLHLATTTDEQSEARKDGGESHSCTTSTKVGPAEERERAALAKAVIKEMLTNIRSNEEAATPFHDFITETTSSLAKYVDKLKAIQIEVMRKERSVPPPKPQLKESLKPDKKAKGGKDKKAGKNGKGGKGGKSKTSSAPSVAVETVALAPPPREMFEEWEAVLLNEVSRAQMRLQLIFARATADLTDILSASKRTFHQLNHEVEARYEREVASVDILVKVFSNAIEEELPIQQECVLEQDKFFVRQKVLLFPDPPPPPPVPIKERDIDTEFRICDLLAFYQKMDSIVAASFIPTRAFVSILDDIITCKASEGEMVVLPNMWSVGIADVPPIVQAIFGTTEYLDWKDFVIYAADVRYPTEQEILLHREQFHRFDPDFTETVEYEDYKAVRLWFEDRSNEDPQQLLRFSLIKELLFTMFKVNETACHYTSLLLYFCRDEDPMVGFAKALTLSLGIHVLATEEEYQSYQDDGLSDSTSIAIRNAIYLAAEQLIDEVVNEVIEIVAGITIEEVLEETPSDSLTVNEEWTAHVPVAETPVEIDFTPTCPTSSEREFDVSEGSPHPSLLVENLESSVETEFVMNFPCTPYLTFGTVLNLLSVSMPWLDWQARLASDSESLSAQLEAVFDELAASTPATRQRVLAYELFRHPYITTLLTRVNKFRACVLSDVVEEQMCTGRGEAE